MTLMTRIWLHRLIRLAVALAALAAAGWAWGWW